MVTGYSNPGTGDTVIRVTPVSDDTEVSTDMKYTKQEALRWANAKHRQHMEKTLWNAWNVAQTVSTSSVTSVYTNTWSQWAAIATQSAATVITGDAMWYHWNNEYLSCEPGYMRRDREIRNQLANIEARRTPEERAAREEAARVERVRRENEARAAALIVEAAKEKAEKLLQSALNDQQKEELKTKGYFHCKSNKGVLYRIRRGTHGNVRKLDPAGNKEVESLCIQPDHVPQGDAMLAQKLMIENDEDSFRRIANKTVILN